MVPRQSVRQTAPLGCSVSAVGMATSDISHLQIRLCINEWHFLVLPSLWRLLWYLENSPRLPLNGILPIRKHSPKAASLFRDSLCLVVQQINPESHCWAMSLQKRHHTSLIVGLEWVPMIKMVACFLGFYLLCPNHAFSQCTKGMIKFCHSICSRGVGEMSWLTQMACVEFPAPTSGRSQLL